ncbi:MAG TPA: hypothetical protein PKI14_01655 [Fervidobacterium sp.]|nr:hypothetical protein [Fervidobacterium sp.]
MVKSEWLKACPNEYRWTSKNGLMEDFTAHMEGRIVWTFDKCLEEFKKYSTMTELVKNSRKAIDIAFHHGWKEELCELSGIQVQKKRKDISKEEVIATALKYTTYYEWSKDCPQDVSTCNRNGWLEEVSAHLVRQRQKISEDSLKESISKFTSISELTKNNPSLYGYLLRSRNLHLTSDLERKHNKKWDAESILEEAKKYRSRSDFYRANRGVKSAEIKHKVSEEVAKILPRIAGESKGEVEVRDFVKGLGIKVLPHFRYKRERGRRFELDVYMPDLKLGIEFDGTYWHSNKLMQSRGYDSKSHHRKMKIDYFKSLGIKILFIEEALWTALKSHTLSQIVDFINSNSSLNIEMKAYQKILRDKYSHELAPINDFSNPVVKPIPAKEARKIIMKYEWLQSMPAVVLHCYGLFFGEHLAGVTVFSPEYSENLGVWDKYGYTGKMILLSRGACVHWAPNWAASHLIAKSINLLPEQYKVITATVDPLAGEIGTIYQACNFKYVGSMKENKNISGFVINGKLYGSRSIRAKVGSQRKEDILKKYPDVLFVKQKSKGRYFYFKGNKYEKRDLEAAITPLIKPYPKRNK